MSEQIDFVQLDTAAPNFCLPAVDGQEVCLADYVNKKTVILFFVREFN